MLPAWRARAARLVEYRLLECSAGRCVAYIDAHGTVRKQGVAQGLHGIRADDECDAKPVHVGYKPV
jgi:hypothetical protein